MSGIGEQPSGMVGKTDDRFGNHEQQVQDGAHDESSTDRFNGMMAVHV